MISGLYVSLLQGTIGETESVRELSEIARSRQNGRSPRGLGSTGYNQTAARGSGEEKGGGEEAKTNGATEEGRVDAEGPGEEEDVRKKCSRRSQRLMSRSPRNY